jgi:limonene-1,2-epoxide hydrolase
MREENIKIVESYLNSLKHKDLSLALLSDDVAFEDPLAGKNTGAKNLKAFLSGFLPAINDVRVHQHICEDDYVVTHWEVDAVFGIIPILEKFRVRDGKIVEAFGFFDPRPIVGS